MKKAMVSLVNVFLGLWMAVFYVYIFYSLATGGTVGEPDTSFAILELLTSIVILAWFLAQIKVRFRQAISAAILRWQLKQILRGKHERLDVSTNLRHNA